MSARNILIAASLNLAMAVILGAFGAHALKSLVDHSALEIWRTANQYHFYHALGLLGLGLTALQRPEWCRGWLVYALLGGILLFCGSLYLLVLSGQRWLGIITPIGGSLWIVAWLGWVWVLWRNKS